MILVGISFGTLYLSRQSIVARRYDDFKIRQRMKEANTGEYDRSKTYYKRKEETS